MKIEKVNSLHFDQIINDKKKKPVQVDNIITDFMNDMRPILFPRGYYQKPSKWNVFKLWPIVKLALRLTALLFERMVGGRHT